MIAWNILWVISLASYSFLAAPLITEERNTVSLENEWNKIMTPK
jgi:hypothetical protein